jgi:hypothetical protein
VIHLVSEGKGRYFRNTQNRHFIYLPSKLAEDSMFPFPLKLDSKVHVKISFNNEKKQLLIEEWNTNSDKTI